MIYALHFLSHSAVEDISIKPEPIMSIGSMAITNSLFTTWLVVIFLIVLALIVKSLLKQKPGKIQAIFEILFEQIQNLLNDITNDKGKTRKMLPLIATIFLFVLVANFTGLLPGSGSSVMVPEAQIKGAEDTAIVEPSETTTAEKGETATTEAQEGEGFHYNGVKYVPLFRAPSSDLNMTFGLAIVVMLIVQIVGFASLKIKYLGKFFNFTGVMQFFVGLLEFVAEFAKVLAFAFRLFGNVFAGEVLLVVMGSFLAIILPMPFYGFEIFVAFIQAFVFAILTAAFINLAMEHHS
jgi:F-type H+-transporting ATPase subunit a